MYLTSRAPRVQPRFAGLYSMSNFRGSGMEIGVRSFFKYSAHVADVNSFGCQAMLGCRTRSGFPSKSGFWKHRRALYLLFTSSNFPPGLYL
jgi:hypothetical protein